LTDKVIIRPAQIDDLPALVRILNHYVTTSHVTFDTEPYAVAQRRGWFDGFSQAGPYRLLVAEACASLVGYASSSVFRAKPAYRTSVETTVYMDPEFVGRGLGAALYGALFEALQKEPRVHRAYGVIALPNPASVSLHLRLGFRLVGTLSEAGFKSDRFWDVSLYERAVNRYDQEHSAD